VTVQCVAPTGSDANDGLSWATPKKSVLAAYDTLPGSRPGNLGGGTIYFPYGSRIGSNADPEEQGLWLLGGSDPQFANPPAGWRPAKPLVLIGQGSIGSNAIAGPAPPVWLSGGSATDPAHLVYDGSDGTGRSGAVSHRDGSRPRGPA
jgi:hypothetical protein